MPQHVQVEAHVEQHVQVPKNHEPKNHEPNEDTIMVQDQSYVVEKTLFSFALQNVVWCD